MGGKKDKKKKAKDPLKKAALAAKKEAKADKAALKRARKEAGKGKGNEGEGGGKGGGKGEGTAPGDDLDALLESYRSKTRELEAVELEPLEDPPFPTPPRGNSTWTLCPSDGTFYMFGGEYYDGAENIVFDELLRWDPDAKRSGKDDDGSDDDDDKKSDANNDVGRWHRILTPPPHPPPRCAHTSVHHNGALYVFGGECATADRYHHYKDLWKFDTKTNTWEEVRARGSPPAARSGHRAVVWRHYMILFGGFHEALRSEARWFNDLHLFDFQTSTWTELKYGKLARLPPPRSACNVAVCTSPTEALFVAGGYSKVKNANAPGASRSEGITHVDCWTLPLKSLANGVGATPPSWERVPRKGEYPSARAGTSCAPHRNKMLVFGGVMDNEGDHHRIQSVFYDDLFALDMERRRWFAMRLKKGAGGKRRRRRKGDGDDAPGTDGVEGAKDGESDNHMHDHADDEDDDEDLAAAARNEEALSSGWDLDQLRHDMFAFIDGEGNVVFEKIEEEDSDGAAKEGRGKEGAALPSAAPQDQCTTSTDATSDNNCDSVEERPPEHITPSDSSTPPPLVSERIENIATSSVMKVDKKGLPTAVVRPTPLPRINCTAVVRNNTLYIYGGVVEVGDREVTLDDCWSIDLNKREKWNCIWPGQMHRQVWKGVDSDNDSYISSDQGADEDSDDDDDLVEALFEPIPEGGDALGEEESKEAQKKARKAAKKAKEKEKRRGVRHEIAELKEKLGVDDGRRTPFAGEAVADFYARTTDHWNAEAAKLAAAGNGEALSTKELRREGFHLARERYEELRPVLDRLSELEGAQAESEEKRAAKKKDKKSKKDRSR